MLRVALPLLVSCGIVAQSAYPIKPAARLDVHSQSAIAERMGRPFAEGTAHPAGVNNCSALLEKGGGRQPGTASPDFQAQKATLAECLILRAMRDGAAARISYLSDLKWDEHVISLLPAELAVNVSGESVRGAAGRAWAAVDRSITASAAGEEQIIVKGEGFRERLILWGWGDFTGDGVQDILVQTLDTLTEGTYRNTRVFILTRKAAGDRIRVVKQVL